MADIPSDDEIHERMHPSAADVALAKEILISLLCGANDATETIPLMRIFLREVDAAPDAYKTSHHQGPADLTHQINHVRWVNAAHQGVAELDAIGLALPAARGSYEAGSPTVGVRTPTGAHGVQCPHYDFSLAQHYRASSFALDRDGQGFVLRDPDLYLRRINATAMHPRVNGTLREAIACYRSMLYLGAAVLLGAASEGAWMDLAGEYLSYCEETGENLPKKLRDELDSETPRVERVQKSLCDMLRSQPGNVLKRANLPLGAIDQLAQAADYYRRTRNYALHFREDELEQLDYAAVGVLLLGATEYFNSLYRLKGAFER